MCIILIPKSGLESRKYVLPADCLPAETYFSCVKCLCVHIISMPQTIPDRRSQKLNIILFTWEFTVYIFTDSCIVIQHRLFQPIQKNIPLGARAGLDFFSSNSAG